MRRSVAACTSVVTAVLLATGMSLAPANEYESVPADSPPRLAAFRLECFVPTTPDLHTRATLVGKLTLESRTVFTVASCADGPAETRWPEFDASDGPVLGIEIGVTAVLEDYDHRPLAWNQCWMHSNKGYLTFRCGADPQRGGEINVLISIAP